MDFNHYYGLQNCYNFRDDDGTDSCGVKNGAIEGTVTFEAGKMVRAARFDGVAGSRINLGTLDIRSASNGISLSCWFNADDFGTTFASLISKGNNAGSHNNWRLSTVEVSSTERIRLRVFTTTQDEIIGTDVISTGTWYFAVGTYNSVSGDLDLYLNGVSTATTVSHSGDLELDDSIGCSIGDQSAGDGSTQAPFDGLIEQAMIWNKVLTTSDITFLYNSGDGRPDAELDFRFGRYPYNVGTGNFHQVMDTKISASTLGFSGSNSGSVSAWAFTRQFDNAPMFHMGTDGTTGAQFGLRTITPGPDTWRVQHSGTPNHDFTYTSLDVWVHFVVTYDGVTSRAYADGVERSSEASTLALADKRDFHMGGGFLANEDIIASFNGVIADVRVYNRALSVPEIQSIFIAKGKDGIVDGLQGRWLTQQFPLKSPGTADGNIAAIGSFVSDNVEPYNHTAPAGTNRVLIVTAGNEHGSARGASAITYGTESLVKIQLNQVTETGVVSSVEMWYLDEKGIADASSASIVVTWATSEPDDVMFISRFFENVDQSTTIKITGGNSFTDNTQTITVPDFSLHANAGNCILQASTAGDDGNYTHNNGYTGTTQVDTSGGDAELGLGFKVITTALASTNGNTPSMTSADATPLRQVMLVAILYNSRETITDLGSNAYDTQAGGDVTFTQTITRV